MGTLWASGLADEATNPIGWFLSAGVGGRSLIPGRERDTFGAGYYYGGTSSELEPILALALGGVGDGDGYGTEVFYNIAVTEWFNLTADAQFITPARETVDSSILLGIRGVEASRRFECAGCPKASRPVVPLVIRDGALHLSLISRQWKVTD